MDHQPHLMLEVIEQPQLDYDYRSSSKFNFVRGRSNNEDGPKVKKTSNCPGVIKVAAYRTANDLVEHPLYEIKGNAAKEFPQGDHTIEFNDLQITRRKAKDEKAWFNDKILREQGCIFKGPVLIQARYVIDADGSKVKKRNGSYVNAAQLRESTKQLVESLEEECVLCFSALVNGIWIKSAQIFSESIYQKKVMEIQRLMTKSPRVNGGQLHWIAGNFQADEMKICLRGKDDDSFHVELHASSRPGSDHLIEKKCAVIFKVPPYKDQNIMQPVTVTLQLLSVKDPRISSEKREFRYRPNKSKRRTKEPSASFMSSFDQILHGTISKSKPQQLEAADDDMATIDRRSRRNEAVQLNCEQQMPEDPDSYVASLGKRVRTSENDCGYGQGSSQQQSCATASDSIGIPNKRPRLVEIDCEAGHQEQQIESPLIFMESQSKEENLFMNSLETLQPDQQEPQSSKQETSLLLDSFEPWQSIQHQQQLQLILNSLGTGQSIQQQQQSEQGRSLLFDSFETGQSIQQQQQLQLILDNLGTLQSIQQQQQSEQGRSLLLDSFETEQSIQQQQQPQLILDSLGIGRSIEQQQQPQLILDSLGTGQSCHQQEQSQQGINLFMNMIETVHIDQQQPQFDQGIGLLENSSETTQSRQQEELVEEQKLDQCIDVDGWLNLDVFPTQSTEAAENQQSEEVAQKLLDSQSLQNNPSWLSDYSE